MATVEAPKSSAACPKCERARERKTYKSGAKEGNSYWYCGNCAVSRVKTWRIDNPDRERQNRATSTAREKQRDLEDPTRPRIRLLRKRHSLTLDQYESMLSRQQGQCAACGTSTPGGHGGMHFHVDHDHSCCSGRSGCGNCVRGLLCARCNTTLGLVDDSTDTLRGLLSYLEDYSRT